MNFFQFTPVSVRPFPPNPENVLQISKHFTIHLCFYVEFRNSQNFVEIAEIFGITLEEGHFYPPGNVRVKILLLILLLLF